MRIWRNLFLYGLFTSLASCSIPSLQSEPALPSQENLPTEPECSYTAFFETQPEFPGGHEAWLAYVKRRQRYPSEVTRAGISGGVFVSFTVAETGQIQEVRVLKGLGYGCDEEAARLVREMPRRKPATHSARAVRVKFNLPVFFGRGN